MEQKDVILLGGACGDMTLEEKREYLKYHRMNVRFCADGQEATAFPNLARGNGIHALRGPATQWYDEFDRTDIAEETGATPEGDWARLENTPHLINALWHTFGGQGIIAGHGTVGTLVRDCGNNVYNLVKLFQLGANAALVFGALHGVDPYDLRMGIGEVARPIVHGVVERFGEPLRRVGGYGVWPSTSKEADIMLHELGGAGTMFGRFTRRWLPRAPDDPDVPREDLLVIGVTSGGGKTTMKDTLRRAPFTVFDIDDALRPHFDHLTRAREKVLCDSRYTWEWYNTIVAIIVLTSDAFNRIEGRVVLLVHDVSIASAFTMLLAQTVPRGAQYKPPKATIDRIAMDRRHDRGWAEATMANWKNTRRAAILDQDRICAAVVGTACAHWDVYMEEDPARSDPWIPFTSKLTQHSGPGGILPDGRWSVAFDPVYGRDGDVDPGAYHSGKVTHDLLKPYTGGFDRGARGLSVGWGKILFHNFIGTGPDDRPSGCVSGIPVSRLRPGQQVHGVMWQTSCYGPVSNVGYVGNPPPLPVTDAYGLFHVKARNAPTADLTPMCIRAGALFYLSLDGATSTIRRSWVWAKPYVRGVVPDHRGFKLVDSSTINAPTVCFRPAVSRTAMIAYISAVASWMTSLRKSTVTVEYVRRKNMYRQDGVDPSGHILRLPLLSPLSAQLYLFSLLLHIFGWTVESLVTFDRRAGGRRVRYHTAADYRAAVELSDFTDLTGAQKRLLRKVESSILRPLAEVDPTTVPLEEAARRVFGFLALKEAALK